MKKHTSQLEIVDCITKLFDKLGIPYWLDSGSLLGLYRDKSLLKWDDDVDLGMWQKDVNQLYLNKQTLLNEGFKVTKQTYDKQIYSLTIKSKINKSLLPIHIHAFWLIDNKAYSPQVVACQPKPQMQQKWATSNQSQLRNFLLWCKKLALEKNHKEAPFHKKVLGNTLCLLVWGSFYAIKEPLDRKRWDLYPFNLIYKNYTWIILSEYFTKLETLSIGEYTFSIPSNTENYLSGRYGTWQKENKGWIYWKDDKCLFKISPQQFLTKLKETK